MILNIPSDLKLQCWDYLSKNNMGNRHSANGNKEQQFVGLIGEILTKNVFGLNHKYINGFDGGFDFEYKGKKIDVKTMGRTVNIKPYFVHNFIGFQKDFDCDIYIFNSLNKISNNLEICGWVTKDELINKSFFYKKGDIRNRDNGTSFKMKADTYEIENRLLNNIKELL
jgi:hypothetical protein